MSRGPDRDLDPAILEYLTRHRAPCTIQEIAASLDIGFRGEAAIRRRLYALQAAGLVRGQDSPARPGSGRRIMTWYRIHPPP